MVFGARSALLSVRTDAVGDYLTADQVALARAVSSSGPFGPGCTAEEAGANGQERRQASSALSDVTGLGSVTCLGPVLRAESRLGARQDFPVGVEPLRWAGAFVG
jgi:hypothetical protein